MKEIKIFSPATVANLSCGFDVLGMCLDTIGDEMQIRTIPEKEVRLGRCTGHSIPKDPKKNVSFVAAQAMYDQLNLDFGFEIDIQKNIKPGSGIGSSSASAIGAVYGMNKLLQDKFNNKDLIRFAMKGEAIASGSEHADNLAPGLYGNFTLIRSYNPLDIIEIKAPEELYATILHPQIEIKTSESRGLLPETIALKDTIAQTGNLAGLIAGLYSKDYELIGRSLEDRIAEPKRSKLIPNYNAVKEAVLKAGALGCGISGSGPSIFALSKGEKIARIVKEDMESAYSDLKIETKSYVSPINQQGIKILS